MKKGQIGPLFEYAKIILVLIIIYVIYKAIMAEFGGV